jgi:hypothetical protein
MLKVCQFVYCEIAYSIVSGQTLFFPRSLLRVGNRLIGRIFEPVKGALLFLGSGGTLASFQEVLIQEQQYSVTLVYVQISNLDVPKLPLIKCSSGHRKWAVRSSIKNNRNSVTANSLAWTPPCVCVCVCVRTRCVWQHADCSGGVGEQAECISGNTMSLEGVPLPVHPMDIHLRTQPKRVPKNHVPGTHIQAWKVSVHEAIHRVHRNTGVR